MSQYHAQDKPGHVVLKGAASGFTATIPMTLFMLITQRFLPEGQRYELPPELIVKDLFRRANIAGHVKKSYILSITLISHFGYGATMGMLYVPLRNMPFPPAVRGLLFGLVVWAASYMGLLPLLGISESGHREPKHRNFMMIVAHMVWGLALSFMMKILVQKK